MFFTLLEDIESVLKEVEHLVEINYYKAGLLNTDEIISYSSIFDSAHLGYVYFGDWNYIESYIILKKEIVFNFRKVQQYDGKTKIAVDPYINPKSIELKIGGIFTKKENVIVAGRVATASDDNDSIELYKLISSRIKKKFKRFGMFYVGEKAEEKLRLGWRLVTNEKLATGFDLTLNG